MSACPSPPAVTRAPRSYHGAQPVIFNVTLLNGMGVFGRVVDISWTPGDNAEMLEVHARFSEVVWPWSGFVALHFTVPELAREWEGVVTLTMHVTVESPPQVPALHRHSYARCGCRRDLTTPRPHTHARTHGHAAAREQ